MVEAVRIPPRRFDGGDVAVPVVGELDLARVRQDTLRDPPGRVVLQRDRRGVRIVRVVRIVEIGDRVQQAVDGIVARIAAVGVVVPKLRHPRLGAGRIRAFLDEGKAPFGVVLPSGWVQARRLRLDLAPHAVQHLRALTPERALGHDRLARAVGVGLCPHGFIGWIALVAHHVNLTEQCRRISRISQGDEALADQEGRLRTLEGYTFQQGRLRPEPGVGFARGVHRRFRRFPRVTCLVDGGDDRLGDLVWPGRHLLEQLDSLDGVGGIGGVVRAPLTEGGRHLAFFGRLLDEEAVD